MLLNCHTAFSFKYGTLRVKDLFAEAKRCGVGKLVLTEINNTASYIEMLRTCAVNAPVGDTNLTKFGKEAYELELALGVEFREGNTLRYIAIARNNHGFEKINRFLSHHNATGKPFPKRAPEFEDVFVIYPFRTEPETLRHNEFIGVRKSDLTQFALYKPFQEYRDKFVVLHPVTFASKKGFNIHRLLRAIANNTLLSKLTVEEHAPPDEIMVSEQDLEEAFRDYPNLIFNTRRLLDECSIDFTLGEDKNKKSVRGDFRNDLAFLREQAEVGFSKRYDATDPVLRERSERELRIIEQKTSRLLPYHVRPGLLRPAERLRVRGSGKWRE